MDTAVSGAGGTWRGRPACGRGPACIVLGAARTRRNFLFLTEAFPLIAAALLVVIGIVLFVTAPAKTTEPSAPAAIATPPPTASPPPAATAQPSAPSTHAAQPVKIMVDAAIAGDDARVHGLVKQLAAERPARGERSRARELNSRALARMRSGRYAEAASLFEAAHRADPGDAEVRENLGYALLKDGRLREAETALLSALEIGPKRASAWGSLGHIYAKRGQHAEAVRLSLPRIDLQRTGGKSPRRIAAWHKATLIPEYVQCSRKW